MIEFKDVSIVRKTNANKITIVEDLTITIYKGEYSSLNVIFIKFTFIIFIINVYNFSRPSNKLLKNKCCCTSTLLHTYFKATINNSLYTN